MQSGVSDPTLDVGVKTESGDGVDAGVTGRIVTNVPFCRSFFLC